VKVEGRFRRWPEDIPRFTPSARFITVDLLHHAWQECKRVEKEEARSALFSPMNNEAVERSEAPSLDRLDDDGINDLYHRTRREYARAAKREVGMIA